MEVGVALPIRNWPEGRPWSFREIASYAEEADSLGYDAVWAMDHFLVEGPVPSAGPDPFVLLSYLAGRTRNVRLGTLVACVAFRSPAQLAREARFLNEASGGRHVLGVGAGSREAEFETLGLPFDHRVSRLEESLQVLAPLLSGEEVDFEGRYLNLRGARIHGGARPRLLIAGAGPRMLSIAARFADAWNGGGRDELFTDQVSALRSAERDVGRAPGSVRTTRRLQALILPGGASSSDGEGPLDQNTVVGDVDEVAARAAEYMRAGCDELILHFAGTMWSNYAPEQLELGAQVTGRIRALAGQAT